MDKAHNIREGENLDWPKLEAYLKTTLPELKGPMTTTQFHGGHANLTYLVKFEDTELIVRRPPFGKIAPGAHDMKREYRVLSKLNKLFPRAPKAFHLCEDVAIIGSEFVVMERRQGVIVRTKVIDCFKDFENIEERLIGAMVDAQATLHLVDYKKASLENLGKPEGFLTRQLAGWTKRWELSKTEENENMDFVGQYLSANMPSPQVTSIIHNDIKLDNCQFQPNNPDLVTSVFDWDMCTIGDPLVDFANTLIYFQGEEEIKLDHLPVQLKGDFPKKDFLKKRYQEKTGLDLSMLHWYEAFAFWKGTVIAQQLYKRYVDGSTSDKRMANFKEMAIELSILAKRSLNI